MHLVDNLFNEINDLALLSRSTLKVSIKDTAEYVQACLPSPAEVDNFSELNKNKA
jgi:hypothetical protein